MNTQPKLETDLTIRSFAYVATQLARSPAALAPSAQYEKILSEAEKHRSALRLLQRDVFEMIEEGLRKQAFTQSERHQMRETVTHTFEHAQEAISRIARQYAPRKLAA